MNCPRCHHAHSRVIDTRPHEDTIRRRRVCGRCGHKWFTHEYTETELAVYVAKRRNDMLEAARLDAIKLVLDAKMLVQKLGH